MFKRSYFIAVVILLVIGFISCFISFSDTTAGMRNSLKAVFSPDYSGTIYLDIGSDYIDKAIGEKHYSDTAQYKLERLIDKTSINGPVVCDDYRKFDEYAKSFKNQIDFANMTVAGVVKTGNIYKRGTPVTPVSEFSGESGRRDSYSECDLRPILMGSVGDNTWQDIGYLSEEKITIVLPPKDSAYYDYVIGQLYVTLDDDNTLTSGDIDRLHLVVKEIIENSIVYTDDMDFEDNYIFIGCEQGSIFKKLIDKNRCRPIYFTKGVYPTVKMFYNDEPLGTLIKEQAIDCKKNFLAQNCGYRYTNNDKYAYATYDGNTYWNSSAPNTINRCSVEYWDYVAKNQ